MPGFRAVLWLLRWSLPVGICVGALVGLALVCSIEQPDSYFVGNLLVGKAGPWGTIERFQFTFEPDLGAISPGDCPETPKTWRFPGTDMAGVRKRLDLVGMTGGEVEALARQTSCDADGCTVFPDVGQVAALFSRIGERLHRELLGNGGNPWTLNVPYRTRRAVHASLAASGLPEGLQKQVLSLWFPWGRRLALADPAPVCRGATDDVKRSLARFFEASDTSLARLLVSADADVDGLANYWVVARRFTGVRSLLASLAKPPCGGRLDVTHLLPAFARERINRLPQGADVDGDGLWFALNFFNQVPQMAWVDPRLGAEALKDGWREVPVDAVSLGDVMRFSAGVREIAGVVVAGELLITRFGDTRFDPWLLSDRNAVVQSLEPLGVVTVQAFRRRVL